MKTKPSRVREVKAWGVYYFGMLDTDEMHWFHAQAYAVFTTRAEAVKWIGDSQSANAKIIAVRIVPIVAPAKEDK
jgi:hypothetical protein